MQKGFITNIPAAKKTDSKDKYTAKAITDTLTNGFFTVDHRWTVKYWNRAAEIILGVKAEDIIGINLWKKFAGIIPLELYAIDQKAFLQDTPVHFEEYWGEMGAWFDVVTYYCDNTLSVSFKSSNQSVNADQQLKTLNELYRFVTEVTNDCLWEWNLITEEIFWIDGGHKRVFGYQVENALIPQSFWESCLHPDDKLRVLASLKENITKGSIKIWEEKYRFKKANGTYAFVHDRGHIIYKESIAVRMIGATQDITEKILLETKLVQQRQATQREITDAVLTAQENERADIGSELQENLNQILGATKLYIQMATASETNRGIYLEKSLGYIVDVMNQINRISKRLAPPNMIIGLVDSINILIHDLSKLNPIRIEFNKKAFDENILDKKLQLNIYRIVQEQLGNILKHANATQADIKLAIRADEIILLITDNGIGCDTNKEKKGLGVKNIFSRVALYYGRASITSKPGKGYELKIILPLSPNCIQVEIF